MFDESNSAFEDGPIPVIPPGLLSKNLRAQHKEDFKTYDRKMLLKMDDKALAEWQSQFESDEPQWMLAEFDWQRRRDRSSLIRGWITIGIAVLSLLISLIALLK
jgi:hypothetical protein